MERIHYMIAQNDNLKRVFIKAAIIFIISCITSSQLKGQELLNKKNSDIDKYIQGKKGKLLMKRYTLDIQMNDYGTMYIYEFPVKYSNEKELYFAMFFFSKEGDCIHYLFRYHTGDYMQDFINKFNNKNSGFTKANVSLKWFSKVNNNISVLIKKSPFINDPTNFEIDYFSRPKNPGPNKLRLADTLRKLFPNTKIE